MKILTVIGARPQIIKAAGLSRAIRENFSDQIQEKILHTGQHYDNAMSEVFFGELGIPKPDFNLNSGSGSHGSQTAHMIDGIEKVLVEEKPDAIVLYGDTNSTLAGAIAASKIHIPVVHIEAGLRSFNKAMPEEINRILCDHVSTLLFSPTKAGIKNLEREGISYKNPPYHIDNPGIFHCGDIMYDNSLYFAEVAGRNEEILERNNIKPNEFILGTIHRNNNTDDPQRLTSILKALSSVAREENLKIILPLHPRTEKMISQLITPELVTEMESSGVVLIKPASFLEMIVLEKNCRMVITDSGGVQKEAYFFKKPCVVLRDETEWTEIVENGNNILTSADEDRIKAASKELLHKTDFTYPSVFGDGKAGIFICKTMLEYIR